jgi:FKBP-type peptidyl-prolyl cis-trans isomerase FkpA
MTSIRRQATALSVTVAALLAATSSLAQGPAPKPTPDFLANAAAAKGAVLSESGLVYLSLKDGTGPAPAAIDTVRVHYRGTFTDGKEFDSSYTRGQPATFPLNRVIKCWTEGVQKMAVGGKARLTCPASIAYGERGTPGGPIPPNAVLQFEVELLGIVKP